MAIEPIVKTITVALPPDRAFDLFTRRIAEWWPLGRHTVSAGQGETAQSLTIEPNIGGEVFEIGHDGTRHVWGHVQTWEPGKKVAVSWHPGQTPERQTRVQVDFEAEDDGTKVTLVHSGWEALGDDGPGARDSYDKGWNGVMAAYGAAG